MAYGRPLSDIQHSRGPGSEAFTLALVSDVRSLLSGPNGSILVIHLLDPKN